MSPEEDELRNALRAAIEDLLLPVFSVAKSALRLSQESTSSLGSRA
jgi:hypothetical protein